MDVQDFREEQFTDLFPELGGLTAKPQGNFTGENEGGVDLFGEKKEEKEEVKQEAPLQGEEKLEEADILGDKKETTYTFNDTSGYFEDRFKSGKFVKVEEEDEEGNKKMFIPKTPEEFDEVIDIQVNYKVEEKLKDLENQWYTSKSPTWQMVAKYAELTDNPEDILPFLQGVKTYNSVADLDPEDIGQAEKIVRERLSQRGEDDDVIAETIDSLKTTDKLVSTAQKYKPAILAQEKQNLQAMVTQQKQQEQEYINLVSNIRENAIKAIEAPFIGKAKLKQDEKAAIYDLIAEPSKETKGYPIYTSIDNLFEKGDFETLKQIALLLAKKDSFLEYISSNASTKTAEGLQKKLRVAAEANKGGKDDDYSGGKQTVQRTQYSTTPRFGR